MLLSQQRSAIVSIQTLPLATRPDFAHTSFEQLAETIEARFGARFAKLPPRAGTIDARAYACRLQQSELWHCAYGMPLSIKFPEGDYLRLQVSHRGVGATWTGKDRMTAVAGQQACISSAAVEIDFAEDFEQLVWRIPRGKLEQKLALMTGRPIGYALDFGPSLDLSTPQGTALRSVFDCLLQAVRTAPSPAASPVIVELEQAFISMFLSTVDHNGRALLEKEAATAAPWQVRRAESHIEANWDQPITIEDLAAVTGTSTRSLFRTFKESRGCSPLDFVRQFRLDHARRMLEKPDATTTVTDVAFACGFGDLGRFAREFQRAFGERPSAILARKRGTATDVSGAGHEGVAVFNTR